jgi:hypothetical protein
MSIVKFIATLSAAVAFTGAVAMAPAAFARNNAPNSTVRTMDDLQQNGWYCMQASDAAYYSICTKPFDQTYECHLGVCVPTPARSTGNRMSTTPNATASTAGPATAPQTRTLSGTRAAPH